MKKSNWITIVLLVFFVAGGIWVGHMFFPPPIAEGKIDSEMIQKREKASQIFTESLRRRFPVGSLESSVTDELRHQGFNSPPSLLSSCEKPAGPMNPKVKEDYTICPFYDPRKSLIYSWFETIPFCSDKLAVGWQSDAQKRIIQIDGRLFRDCF